MIFASEIFLFLFLPVFLTGYYLTPLRYRSWSILLGSYVFYGWWRIDFLGLLILTTLWTFAFGRLISRHQGTGLARLACSFGVAGCLAVLGVFKYLNFFVDSLADLLGTDPANLGIHWRLILPIGISFYVFQSISYLIDVTRRDAPAASHLVDFAAFIALFPQLIAGPILRYKDLQPQFRQRIHSAEIFTDGVARFTIGLAKKVLLADTIAPLADLAFQTPEPSALLAWLGAIAYMLQLYFDFSGYSDMAIGLGLMMGFRFTPNFNAPYQARSITAFWRRWHISLSVWLRDYLYFPLGGNRRGERRTFVNLIIVMLLGGMWHGANWTFLVWGGWHGVWLALERWFANGIGVRIKLSLVPTLALTHFSTLLIILLGWVVFRADSLTHAWQFYGSMNGVNGWLLPAEMAVEISRESLIFLTLALMVVAVENRPLPPLLTLPLPQMTGQGALAFGGSSAQSVALSALAVFTLMKLAEQSFSPFLYFQF